MTFLPFLLVRLLIIGGLVFRHMARRRKRERLLATPLTAEQRAIVERLVPILRRLPETLRPGLEGRMNLFLDQITLHGNQGLELKEEMKLSIAAQACLLVVNSPVWCETLRTVLVYPSAFFTRRPQHDGFVVHEMDSHMAGENWDRGPIVL